MFELDLRRARAAERKRKAEPRPTVSKTYELSGYVYRQIRTASHVFIHTVKGSYFVFSSGFDRGQIEVYSIGKRTGLERFEGYAVGSNFDRLYACFAEVTRQRAGRPGVWERFEIAC